MCREQQREEEGYGLRELEEEQPEKKKGHYDAGHLKKQVHDCVPLTVM